MRNVGFILICAHIDHLVCAQHILSHAPDTHLVYIEDVKEKAEERFKQLEKQFVFDSLHEFDLPHECITLKDLSTPTNYRPYKNKFTKPNYKPKGRAASKPRNKCL